jgi:hypothetical protein
VSCMQYNRYLRPFFSIDDPAPWRRQCRCFWHLTDVTSRAADIGSSKPDRHNDSAGGHPTPACNAIMVTLAPTDDGALRLN